MLAGNPSNSPTRKVPRLIPTSSPMVAQGVQDTQGGPDFDHPRILVIPVAETVGCKLRAHTMV